MTDDKNRNAAGTVAIILAASLGIALNVIVIALLWVAVSRYVSGANIGLSENGTQLLTGAFGGIIGVLGSFLGYTLGKRSNGNGFLPPEP